MEFPAFCQSCGQAITRVVVGTTTDGMPVYQERCHCTVPSPAYVIYHDNTTDVTIRPWNSMHA